MTLKLSLILMLSMANCFGMSRSVSDCFSGCHALAAQENAESAIRSLDYEVLETCIKRDQKSVTRGKKREPVLDIQQLKEVVDATYTKKKRARTAFWSRDLVHGGAALLFAGASTVQTAVALALFYNGIIDEAGASVMALGTATSTWQMFVHGYKFYIRSISTAEFNAALATKLQFEALTSTVAVQFTDPVEVQEGVSDAIEHKEEV